MRNTTDHPAAIARSCILLALVPAFLLFAAPLPAMELSNRFINITVDDTNGKFTMGTVAGDPARNTDDNQDLLFGHPGGSTSDTIVCIDGTKYEFGATGVRVDAPANTGSANTCSWNVAANVHVRQTLTIVRSNATRNEDTCEIKYTITNNDTAAHNVALRIQLDTLLGSNDGAPFMVPFYGKVTTDTEWDNDDATTGIPDIPQFCHVFDSLSNPTVFSMITLTGIGFRTPDRFVLGYWPESTGAWDYTIVPTRSFLDNDGDGTIDGNSPDSDSSVVVWWGSSSAIALAPGQSVDLAIHYGLSNLNFTTLGPLQIGLTAPSELTFLPGSDSFQYTPNPFTVVAYFENTSQNAAADATITLNLPPEFKLFPGEQLTKPVEKVSGSGTLPAGESAQVIWQAQCNGRTVGERRLSATVQYGGSAATLKRTITVPGAANAVFGTVIDTSGNALAGAVVTITAPSGQVTQVTSGADGTFYAGSLTAGNYEIRVTAGGRVATVLPVTVGSETPSVNPVMASESAAALEAFAYPNPAREDRVNIRFSGGSAGSVEIKIFDTAGNLIKTITTDSAGGAQWQEVRWDTGSAANGVYFYTVKAGGSKVTGKIAVLKKAAMR